MSEQLSPRTERFMERSYTSDFLPCVCVCLLQCVGKYLMKQQKMSKRRSSLRYRSMLSIAGKMSSTMAKLNTTTTAAWGAHTHTRGQTCQTKHTNIQRKPTHLLPGEAQTKPHRLNKWCVMATASISSETASYVRRNWTQNNELLHTALRYTFTIKSPHLHWAKMIIQSQCWTPVSLHGMEWSMSDSRGRPGCCTDRFLSLMK